LVLVLVLECQFVFLHLSVQKHNKMKKLTLIAAGVLFCVAATCQQHATPKPTFQAYKAPVLKQALENPQHSKQINPAIHNMEGGDFVSIASIGTAGNAYGYAARAGSFVCVNQEINTVTNFHFMGGYLDPGGFTGDLGYDISTDGGMTWTNMIEIYTANDSTGGGYFTDAARYPNHGIYNPIANTEPNEAYVAFFASALGGGGGIPWSGYMYGRGNIGNIDDTTSHFIPADTVTGMFPSIIQGYTMTNLGEFWAVCANQDWSSGTIVFLEELVLTRGIWNDEIEDFEVTQSLLPCETLNNFAPADIKVEFSPDGQTGYIAALTDNGTVPFSSGRSLYPILWKTTDAGDTWIGPMPVAIAGGDGISEIQNFLSDDELAELFGTPIPDVEEIEFTTAYDFDLSVDAWGNPQIAVICGITGEDPYSIITAMSEVSGYIFTSAFLINSMDGGENFSAYNLGRQKTFRGTFGDITTDNRIQIARSHDGTKMFVSWLDTDLPGVYDNQQPDIYARGVDIVFQKVTENENGEPLPNNVTEFSEGMWQAYFFAMGNEVFSENEIWTIPYVYMDLDPLFLSEPIQFRYVQDFDYTIYDFPIDGVDELNNGIEVTQNYPNPAKGTTTVTFSLKEPAKLSFEILNITGQKVFEIPPQKYSNGQHQISFDVSQLPGGVYFYTLTSGEGQVSRKMIVE
jgi:hypothetical protein